MKDPEEKQEQEPQQDSNQAEVPTREPRVFDENLNLSAEATQEG